MQQTSSPAMSTTIPYVVKRLLSNSSMRTMRTKYVVQMLHNLVSCLERFLGVWKEEQGW